MKRNFFLYAVLCVILTLTACTDSTTTFSGGDTDGDETADGDGADGDVSDGDSATDGDDAEDGDIDVTIPDGDTTDGDASDGDVTDGDVSDGDTTDGDIDPVKGHVAGTLFVGEDMDWARLSVSLYADTPFQDDPVEPVQELRLSREDGDGPFSFAFYNLESGTYWLAAYLKEDNTPGDPDMISPYPETIEIDLGDPARMGIDDADLYLGAVNPDLGSLSGTLNLGENWKYGVFVVVATRELPSDTEPFMPAAVQISLPEEPVGNQRPFALNNLPSGSFYLMAFLASENDSTQLWVQQDSPFAIDINDPAKQHYGDLPFYIGMSDPDLGTASGLVRLEAPVPGGDLAVAAFVGEPGEGVPPVAYTPLMTIQDQVRYDFTIGNLPETNDLYVLAIYSIGEDKRSMNGDGPFTIDFETAKDISGIVIRLATTTLRGHLSLTGAQMSIASASLELFGEEAYYTTEFPLTDEGGGAQGGLFEIFPVRNVSVTPRLWLDVTGDGVTIDDYECILDEFIIQGRQFSEVVELTADFNNCYLVPD